MKKNKRIFGTILLILAIVFFYLPIAYMIVFSFNDSKSLTSFTGFSLRWYEHMLASRDMMQSLYTTFSIAIISTIVSTVVGTIAAEALVFLVQVWSVRKELPILRYIKNCAVFVPIGAVMFWIVQHAGDLVQNGTLRIVFQVAVGGVCYLLCSSVYFYFKKDSIFMEMIKKIKR